MNGSKDRLLNAAEQIVLRDGAMRLTLEAVAAESGMSKGGLLYHFRSKDELVQAMIDRLHREYEEEVGRLIASDANPHGRRLRAMLRASFPERPAKKRMRLEQLSAALLAAVVTNPKLLEQMQERIVAFEQTLQGEGLDPVVGTMIHCAADGLWLTGLFGIAHSTRAMRKKLIAHLIALTEK